MQGNRLDPDEQDRSKDGSERMPEHRERGAVRRARSVQDLVAVLPPREPAHRPDLAVGHHFHVAVRAAPGRGQLELRRLAVLERPLLGREGGRHVDVNHTKQRPQARQPVRHTQEMAADILRHGHQPDTAAVRAVATVAAVRHIATAATAVPTADQKLQFPVGPSHQRIAGVRRRTVHIPIEHRGNTVAGRVPEPARLHSRRQRNRGEPDSVVLDIFSGVALPSNCIMR